MTHSKTRCPWVQFYRDGPDHRPRHSDALASFRDAAKCPTSGVDYFGTYLSYAEVDEASDRLAAWALSQGVQPGARLSIVLHNVPSFLIAAVAAWKIGAIPVPGNPAYKSTELSRIFADSEPSLVICHDAHWTEVTKALQVLQGPIPVLTVSPYDHAAHPDSRILPAEIQASTPTLSSIIRSPYPAPPRRYASAEDTGLVLYTSGTTGRPKGAMLRHRGLTSNAQLMAEWCGVHDGSRILGIAPLFHITGFVCHFLMSLAMQCKLVLNYRFEPAAVLDVIRRTRPTYSVGAVTAFNALAAQPSATAQDFSCFESVFSGAPPLRPPYRTPFENGWVSLSTIAMG